MPGVPSGRGCDGCRAQKKKCDQSKPSCGRCTRLKLVCVGSGERRYKFKDGFPTASKKQVLVAKSAPITTGLVRINGNTVNKTVPYTPTNELSRMLSAFVDKINFSTTDYRYNLAWSFGGFLVDVPQRLGVNEALDASVAAVVVAHSDFSARKGVTAHALMKYSRALNALRKYLDDPVKANASETLGAVMILLICQQFIGGPERLWTGHCEGAAKMLKARRYYNPNDEFEAKIVLTLGGPVLFEGLLNPNIQFSPKEWKTLVQNHLNKDTHEGRFMYCLSRVPEFMQRIKAIRETGIGDSTLLDDMRTNYDALKAALSELYIQLQAVEKNMPDDSTPTTAKQARAFWAHNHLQRLYSLVLTIGIILNSVLSSIDAANAVELAIETTQWSWEIIGIAEDAVRYRPLGACCLPLALAAAWVGGMYDPALRPLVEKWIIEYENDFPVGDKVDVNPRLLFEELLQQCRLADVETPMVWTV
ncbi:hypothetical protein AJ80_00511 [Polytolypa hystricis UAMH7299]|uniref:Zn(2)-C6 fungal-type domain-containing protein n=1 Tax=Polytolypa hystricis (strain UAMH7299) TaxID=1447883 RepID=A0A2B7YUI4_POLH7|nr:hypothetical protein AJ80_00511 [Polytolypa hystricis UAMH7299]